MKRKIVQLAHVTDIPGPVQTLAEFITKNKTNDLTKIYFDLNNGKVLGYISDFFEAWRKIKNENQIDIAIGMNCFDTLPLVWLRKNRIKKIILFGTDFSRKRFKNPILNWVYVSIDRYCAKKADFVCSNSRRTINQRLVEGVDNDKLIYVPNGVFLRKVKANQNKNFEKKLVFIGHVTKEHGLHKIMELVLKNELTLDVIGDGPELNNLRQRYKDKKINFRGKKSHTEVMRYLANFGGFGLASYVLELDWTYYCDPVKVKEYLVNEVPVIISDVPEISKEIKDNNWGYVFRNKKQLTKILKKIKTMTSHDYYLMINKIKGIKTEFDLDEIYTKMFEIIGTKNLD